MASGVVLLCLSGLFWFSIKLTLLSLKIANNKDGQVMNKDEGEDETVDIYCDYKPNYDFGILFFRIGTWSIYIGVSCMALLWLVSIKYELN